MRRLYARLYLSLLLVLVAAGAVTGVVMTSGTRGAFLRHLAETMATHTAAMLGSSPADRRAETLDRLSHELDLDLALVDPDGAPIASAGRALPRLSPSMLAAAKEAPQVEGDRRSLVASAPVFDDAGALVGVLEVAPRLHFGPHVFLPPVVWNVMVLLLFGVAAFPLARAISRPVDRLTEASRRFGEGELSYRIPAEYCGPRRDELTALTRAWNEMAERIESQVKGQRELLANVSHELRSPLARIRVALELLPEGAREGGRLDDVETDLAELDRLIESVLTTSRLQNGLPLKKEPVDVASLLEALSQRAAHDPVVAGKSVRVETSGDLKISADGGLLKRAIWNLVENAGKYGAAPIVLAARRTDGRLSIEVTDEGPGIAAADRSRVFEPFYRADKARTPSAAGAPSQGFGLGLTLARRIAEAHGGAIRAEPLRGDGGGCRMVLDLPV